MPPRIPASIIKYIIRAVRASPSIPNPHLSPARLPYPKEWVEALEWLMEKGAIAPGTKRLGMKEIEALSYLPPSMPLRQLRRVESAASSLGYPVVDDTIGLFPKGIQAQMRVMGAPSNPESVLKGKPVIRGYLEEVGDIRNLSRKVMHNEADVEALIRHPHFANEARASQGIENIARLEALKDRSFFGNSLLLRSFQEEMQGLTGSGKPRSIALTPADMIRLLRLIAGATRGR